MGEALLAPSKKKKQSSSREKLFSAKVLPSERFLGEPCGWLKDPGAGGGGRLNAMIPPFLFCNKNLAFFPRKGFGGREKSQAAQTRAPAPNASSRPGKNLHSRKDRRLGFKATSLFSARPFHVPPPFGSSGTPPLQRKKLWSKSPAPSFSRRPFRFFQTS